MTAVAEPDTAAQPDQTQAQAQTEAQDPALGVGVEPGPPALAGLRLHRLELLNWGSFDRRVHTVRAEGGHALLTGDLGNSSTAVLDALGALLHPAGPADLRARVRGHWRTEREEATGVDRPVALRPGTTWSALVAVFRDAARDTCVSVGQVLWLREGETGQPERFHVLADRDLSIAEDLSEFGGDPAALARRLRARSDVSVTGSATEQERSVRLRLGVPSERAARLLQVAASPAAIGRLDSVVGEHLLGAEEVTSWIDRIAGHVEDLTRSHAIVLSTRAQLAALSPMVADADELAGLTEQLSSLDAELLALPGWADRWRERLLSVRATRLRAEVTAADRELAELAERLDELRTQVEQVSVDRAGHGGDQVARIDARLRDLAVQRRERRARADVHARVLTATGLERVGDEHAFRARREQAAVESVRARETAAAAVARIGELAARVAQLQARVEATGADLTAVRAGAANLSPAAVALRDRMATALGLATGELPFVGELAQVAPAHTAWQPAADAVLGELAATVLVPDRHHTAVTGWLDQHRPAIPLTHLRLPARLPAGAPLPPARSLAAVLEVRDCPLAGWLQATLTGLAHHLRVDSDAEFTRTPAAVTRDGRVKDVTGRHTAAPAGDPVLSWSSQAREATLQGTLEQLQSELDGAVSERENARAQHTAAVDRDRELSRLAAFEDWRDLDWRASVEAIAAAKEERAHLLVLPNRRTRLDAQLTDLRMDLAKLETTHADTLQRRGTAVGARDESFRMLAVVRRRLGVSTEGTDDSAETSVSPGASVPDPAAALLGVPVDDPTPAQRLDRRGGVAYSPPTDTDDVDERERQLRAALDDERNRRLDVRSGVEQRLVTALARFLLEHPGPLGDLPATVAAAGDVRALHERLGTVELPAAEAAFTEQLTDRVVRDLAGFLAELDRRADRVHERIAEVDDALYGIDVAPGRHLGLSVRASTSAEVARFRAALRGCADGVGAGWVGAASARARTEELLDRITALVSRLRGSTETDRRWAARVTDVRNWFVVTVTERWRSDGSPVAARSRAGGREQQDQAHAATVLTAALVRALGLDLAGPEAPGLRLVTIDQFSRPCAGRPAGPASSGLPSVQATRTMLELGDRLGLQLLVVTPVHEVAAVEPWVGTVGYLADPDGRDARLRSLTVTAGPAPGSAHAAAG